MSAPQPVELVSSTQVADMFHVSRGTSSRWGKDGTLLTWPVPGNARGFFAVEVRALLAGEAPEAARKLAEAERDRLQGGPPP